MFGKGLSFTKRCMHKIPGPQTKRRRQGVLVAGIAQFGAIQAVAPALGVEITPISVHDIDIIERAVEAFAHRANGGLIVTAAATLPAVTRDLIINISRPTTLPSPWSEVRGLHLIADG
jgi:hypothetical protein